MSEVKTKALASKTLQYAPGTFVPGTYDLIRDEKTGLVIDIINVTIAGYVTLWKRDNSGDTFQPDSFPGGNAFWKKVLDDKCPLMINHRRGYVEAICGHWISFNQDDKGVYGIAKVDDSPNWKWLRFGIVQGSITDLSIDGPGEYNDNGLWVFSDIEEISVVWKGCLDGAELRVKGIDNEYVSEQELISHKVKDIDSLRNYLTRAEKLHEAGQRNDSTSPTCSEFNKSKIKAMSEGTKMDALKKRAEETKALIAKRKDEGAAADAIQALEADLEALEAALADGGDGGDAPADGGDAPADGEDAPADDPTDAEKQDAAKEDAECKSENKKALEEAAKCKKKSQPNKVKQVAINPGKKGNGLQVINSRPYKFKQMPESYQEVSAKLSEIVQAGTGGRFSVAMDGFSGHDGEDVSEGFNREWDATSRNGETARKVKEMDGVGDTTGGATIFQDFVKDYYQRIFSKVKITPKLRNFVMNNSISKLPEFDVPVSINGVSVAGFGTGTDLGTSSTLATAVRVGARVQIDDQWAEDSGINIMPIVNGQLAQHMGLAFDSLVMNGQNVVTGPNAGHTHFDGSLWGSAAGSGSTATNPVQHLADGIIYLGINTEGRSVDLGNTTDINGSKGLTGQNFLSMFDELGIYSAEHGEDVLAALDYTTYNRLRRDPMLIEYLKANSLWTLAGKPLDALFGSQIFATQVMGGPVNAQVKFNSDGVYDNSCSANNTKSRMAFMYAPACYWGVRTALNFEVQRVNGESASYIMCYARVSFTVKEDVSTQPVISVGYDF